MPKCSASSCSLYLKHWVPVAAMLEETWGKGGGRGTTKEATATVQESDDGSSHEKWMNAGEILKMNPQDFQGVDMG